MKKENLLESYLNSVAFYRNLEKREEKLVVLLSLLRLLVFIGGIITVWIVFTKSTTYGVILALFFTALFLGLLKLFLLFSEKKDFLSNIVRINQNEADALSGNYEAFDTGKAYADMKHDFSFDVDLFGESSLFQYLNRTVTGYGRDILAAWLSDPFNLSKELINRQEAVRELAMKDKWRQEFMASGMKTPLEKDKILGMISWLKEKETISSSSLKKIMIFSLPSIVFLTIVLWAAGIIPYTVATFFLLCNLIYVAAGLKRTNDIHKSLSRKYDFLSSMNGLLKAFENESFSSAVMNDIKQNITGKDISASVSVKKLGRLIQAFDNRNNMLVGFVLNALLLWDYLSIFRLEKWKIKYRNKFAIWLEMIGQVDAYISFGNYAYNNPDFVFPEMTDEGNVFSAKNLGHQLIDENKRVCNDFSLGKKGTVCIISGANMAGKSTFLRTVAVNYILAMSGAPVCASEMRFIPAKLFTSMRTTDSLSGNESYFYAELRLLNALKSRIDAREPVFFILDEILKGTNSEDKSTGSRLFLQGIIEKGGTGLLATHDTALGKLEGDYPGIIINKCFEIEINGSEIRFDYKIQDGITQKMNAVFLMRQMGILKQE